MLTKLKSFLKEQKIDFFLLPNSDEFFSEYLPESEKRIQQLTGFSGSNAMIIVAQEKTYFFTDGRYTLQARNELDANEFEIFDMAEKSVLQWIEEILRQGRKLALDPKLTKIGFAKVCRKIAQKNNAEISFLEKNPVDEIWENRPSKSNSAAFFCDQDLTGADSKKKREIILRDLEVDAVIISKPENICWMLNIRAADIEFTPLLLVYAILFKDGKVDLFIDEKRIQDLENSDLEDVNLINPADFNSHIASLKIEKIQIDPASTNYWLWDLLQKNNLKIIEKIDAAELAKACKSDQEIKSAIKSHEIDGLAVTKFLFWLEESVKNKAQISEISVAEKLLEFRKENENFLYPSFSTISGFASNGAIIHYCANEKTDKKILHQKGEGELYLVDSGGQYFPNSGSERFFGTTDVTRTIAVGKPSKEMIENFTRVLKGHIALARAKFPRGTSGAQLDVLAREHLWRSGKDYAHGTGHGVGSFLSVHEGPCGISKRVHQPLLEGMILSNEPGFYENGEYGIRIESLMLVEEFDENFLQFKTLTLAPIDPSLIEFRMLTYPERKWLFDYHERILETISGDLKDNSSKDALNWLKSLADIFKNYCCA